MNIIRIIRIKGIKLAEIFGLYQKRQREYFKMIFKVLSISINHVSRVEESRKVVLDLGCGGGWFTNIIAKLPILAVGIDVNFNKVWNVYKNSRLMFVVADARFLPIQSNTVDIIIALSLLEHVFHWDKIISEAHRVLKRGGLFIIQLPNLKYIVEPHTKFPLLGFLPRKLKLMITSSAGYGELQFSCSIKNVIKELRKYNFKYWISYYYHMGPRITLYPPSYFIIALKSDED